MSDSTCAWLIKPVPVDRDGNVIAARAATLRKAGVRTPTIHFEPTSGVLRIRRVCGADGRSLLHDAADPARWVSQLRRFVQPLVRLHAIDPAELGLAPYDPALRVRPRLRGQTPLQARAAAIWPAIEAALGATMHDPSVALHGDYHPGQLIVPPGRRQAWLLDLDDLATGPAEIDHGNLVAYLVSRLVLAGMDGPAALRILRAALLALPVGRRLRPRTLDAAVAASLVRRALKLEERGGVGAVPALLIETVALEAD